MQDFTITSADKAAMDAFTTGTPDKPAPLFIALQGRRIEFAPLAPLTTWAVEPVIGIGEDGLPTTTTEGRGLEITYRATLRVWDDQPVEIAAPDGITFAPRGFGEVGFDMPAPVPPEAIPEGVKVPFPDVISDRQFAVGLTELGYITEEEALAWLGPGTLPAAIATFIEATPTENKFRMKALLTGATQFERSHELTGVFGNAVGLSPMELDQFWMRCATL